MQWESVVTICSFVADLDLALFSSLNFGPFKSPILSVRKISLAHFFLRKSTEGFFDVLFNQHASVYLNYWMCFPDFTWEPRWKGLLLRWHAAFCLTRSWLDVLWSEFGQTPWRRVWIRPEIRSFPRCRSPETSVRSRARSTGLRGRGGRKFASEVGCLTGTRCKDAKRWNCYVKFYQTIPQLTQ